MLFKVLVSSLITLLFIVLYKKASGSLSLEKLNIISSSFYLLLITALVGGIAIFYGFRNHYVILHLSDEVVQKGFFIIAYSLITLPAWIIVFNTIMGIRDYNKFYSDYINAPVEQALGRQNRSYIISVLITLVCFMSVVYTLYYVGYVPLIEVLKGRYNLLQSSVEITREFKGNVYIRNILAIGFTPLYSYFAYINYYYTKANRWRVLFIILFVLSILIKTYDLSKSPVVIYLFYFYLIQVMASNSGSLKIFVRYILVASGIIIAFYYVLLGYEGNLLSFTNGPVSRLFISQIAGLFRHVEIFPEKNAFLRGASFSKSFAFLTGANEYGQRSGRVVMSILYPIDVNNNASGVMNTLFAAEAYANYGMNGVLIAPIIVSFCISVIPNFILRQRKTPLNMTIYIMFAYLYLNALIGGFVDFIYNAVLISLLFIFLLLESVVNGGIIHVRK